MTIRPTFPEKNIDKLAAFLCDKNVTIDAKLSFDKYIEQIYAKTKAKLKALAKIASFMKTQKRKS